MYSHEPTRNYHLLPLPIRPIWCTGFPRMGAIMNWFTGLVNLTIFLALSVVYCTAHAKTFSEAPQQERHYEGEDLAWQQGAKDGLPPCLVLSKMAIDIQVIRNNTGDSYEAFHQTIETSFPDRLPEFDENGEVVKRGLIQLVFRRQIQYIGKVVYSMDENMPPEIVGEVVRTQCSGGDNF